MSFIVEAFFSGCISKVVNDGTDFSMPKIKSVINDKKNRNLSTKIYRIIEGALILVIDKKFKDTDKLYGAMERIFIEFRDNGDTIESVKCGLGLLCTDISVQRCENFLEKFYEGIRRDDDLYKAVIWDLEQKGIKISQEEFQKINEKLDNLTEIVSSRNDNENDLQKREPVKSRTQEYLDKWDANMFLNDFSEWDENAGANVKLKDVYIEAHLPHFKYGHNEKEYDNLDILLSKYIIKTNENKMLLILGQPGIGKSTLITWIVTKFNGYIENILVYKFADDLKNVDWQNPNVSERILEALNLSYNDLDGKTLILDGFDEVSIGVDRKEVLDNLYGELIYKKNIEKFSLIITCRENYIQKFERVKCNYIILQPWDEIQITSFCNIYHEKAKNSVSDGTKEKLVENKEILGIPLILYMVLALDISIEKDSSIVDVYDKIFSLEGGIYDRCIDNKKFAGNHRIGEVKEYIHQISREIAIWMFENNPHEACIPQEEYEKICDYVMKDYTYEKEDFKIGNFFKSVKHCEGTETEELYFVHRSIYEYFVVETIYSSIENAMVELTKKSQKELAGKIAIYLKQGEITKTIGEYLQYKIMKLYNRMDYKKKESFYQWWENAIEKMIGNGMFYYSGKNIQNLKNIIDKEIHCFFNLVKILRLVFKVSTKEYMLENADKEQLEKYIKFGCVMLRMQKGFAIEILNLRKMSLVGMDLSYADLKIVDLRGADLRGVYLRGADLREKNLQRMDLQGINLEYANLQKANLEEADLRGAKLAGIDLKEANIKNTIFDESQVYDLIKKYSLKNSKVFVFDEKKVVSYKDYCGR